MWIELKDIMSRNERSFEQEFVLIERRSYNRMQEKRINVFVAHCNMNHVLH